MTRTEVEYNALTCVQLRAICKRRGLVQNGVKKVVIERLMEHDLHMATTNTTATTAASAPAASAPTPEVPSTPCHVPESQRKEKRRKQKTNNVTNITSVETQTGPSTTASANEPAIIHSTTTTPEIEGISFQVSDELKNEFITCTMIWFALLLFVYITGNITNVLGESAWDVQYQNVRWSEWYGLSTVDRDVEVMVVTIVDQDVLQQAKVMMRADRKVQHEIDIIGNKTAGLRLMSKILDRKIQQFDEWQATTSSMMDTKVELVTKLDELNSDINRKQHLLREWEKALINTESAFQLLQDGFSQHDEVNAALIKLSKVSLIPFSARLFDPAEIHFPGEGCQGKDYIPPKTTEEANIDVEGVGIDAPDLALIDAPLTLYDAQAAYKSLISLAKSSSESLIGTAGPSSHAQKWVEDLIKEEFQKKFVEETLSKQMNLPDSVEMKAVTSPTTAAAYDAHAASKDIDSLLEIEDADRTGKFDYASVVNGARVLRRGPRATSLSLYESLPLINQVLAATNLRFYGHPPEVALHPATTLHARGNCWSFNDESSSLRIRGKRDDFRGEYATLTVSLSQKIAVTEVMIDHAFTSIANSAVQNFRIIGYEDSGAFGEPWQLGSFEYNKIKLGLQKFTIPVSIDGTKVPKLKAISLAVDSNWGGDYSCLYRFRIHSF